MGEPQRGSRGGQGTVRAACVGCERAYRLPAGSAARRCPECGGEVRPLARRAATPADQKGVRTEEASRAERGALQRSVRYLGPLRNLCAVAAFVAAALAFLMVGELHPEVSGMTWFVFVGALLVAVVCAAGTFLIPLWPFPFALALAVVSTPVALALIAEGRFGALGVVERIFTVGIWPLAFWAAVRPAWIVQRLLDGQSGEYAAHAALGTAKERRRILDEGGSEDDVEALFDGAVRRRYAWAGAVAVLLLGWIGSTAVLNYRGLGDSPTARRVAAARASRPGPIEPALERFTEDWDAAVEAGSLGALAASAGLVLSEPPEPANLGSIRSAEPLVDGPDAEVSFDLDGGGVLVAQFAHGASGWALERLMLPAAELEPALARFTSAWNAGDVQALADLAAPSERGSTAAMLERVAEARGWGDAWPPIAAPAALDRTGDRAASSRYALGGDAGELQCNWKAGDEGTWFLAGLRPPR